MAIPALVWLVVGVFVSVVSLKVPNLLFFFYIGLIFIGIGVAKLVGKFILKKKVSKLEVKVVNPQLFKTCYHCKSHVRGVDLFCWRCGARLR